MVKCTFTSRKLYIYIIIHSYIYIYICHIYVYIYIYICVCLFVWDFSSRYLRFTMCFDHPIFCWRSPEKKPPRKTARGSWRVCPADFRRFNSCILVETGIVFFFHVKFAGEDLSELELMGIEFWCEVPWSPISLGLMREWIIVGCHELQGMTI